MLVIKQQNSRLKKHIFFSTAYSQERLLISSQSLFKIKAKNKFSTYAREHLLLQLI